MLNDEINLNINEAIDCLVEIDEWDCPDTKHLLLTKIAHLYKLSDKARLIIDSELIAYTEYCDDLKKIVSTY